MSTPVLIYPYERTRAALDSMAKAGKPHPAHGFRLRYANPATGKHPFPTMAVSMQRLPKGFAGKTYRSTGSAVFAVHRGTGTAQIGDKTFAIAPHDVFVAPPWQPYSFTRRQRDRAVQLFRPRRAGGAGLLARADRMIAPRAARRSALALAVGARRCTRSRPSKR